MNTYPHPSTPYTSAFQTLLACAVVALTMLALIVLGQDGRRAAQVAALALPACAWMLWPARSPRLHAARSLFLWAWAMCFVVDGAVRAYLQETYQAAADSSLVQSAAANTNGREAAEYLSMHWRALVVWSGVLVVCALLLAKYVQRGARAPLPWSRWGTALVCCLLLAGALGYASKPWRRWHPVIFWSEWTQSVQDLQKGWGNYQKNREDSLARASAASPAIIQAGPATLVLVITDSVNRDNMSLYGYPRVTTPRLSAHKELLQDQMLVLRNAWSVDASTVPSLHNIFNFGTPASEQPQHILALARAAGYKVWWMSNHDDIAIEQQHAKLADVVEMVNRTPGRAGASLDGELLDCLQEALEDPTERKLIVVHLMGAHPHYRLRFPADANPFDDQPDKVEASLEQSGKSAWVRKFRQEYDAAMLYNDFVVSETLQLARTAGQTKGYRAWMFMSDHGQEVGHDSNRAGHSPSTASGYRIPALVWRNETPTAVRPDAEKGPFRADWAAWTIGDLLHLSWNGNATDRNALAANYRWQPPTLPMPVKSFEE